MRLSLRYQRIAQLEEGYGISLEPLAELARDAYGDDPCEWFAAKGEAGSDPLLVARMQKAIAILQFKLEGALFRRHPEWELEHRAVLHRIDPRGRHDRALRQDAIRCATPGSRPSTGAIRTRYRPGSSAASTSSHVGSSARPCCGARSRSSPPTGR